MRARTLGLTVVALLAFAANSWLCRAALRAAAIDPASFTAVRLASGALVLALLMRTRRAPGEPAAPPAGSWGSAAALAAYALAFSFAYLGLDAGTGALILFPSVQLTMLAGGVLAGQRLQGGEVLGVGVALLGLVVLGAPGASAPPPWAGAGMTLAGVAWGIYSLRGRGVDRPLAATADNFRRTVPVAGATLAIGAIAGSLAATPRGLALAALSGGVTSGLGYAVWYAALPALRPILAGMAQLAVPVLTAVGGVLLLGERVTPRLVAAAALIVGGLALALSARRRPAR